VSCPQQPLNNDHMLLLQKFYFKIKKGDDMKTNLLNDPVNLAIMKNEKYAFDWVLNNLAWELYWFADFFQIAFFKDEIVPTPALSFDNTNIRVLGHYVIGRNAFGVRDNININEKHLNMPFWQIISTLLNELCHSWEYVYVDEKKRTKSWYHPKPFRNKMRSFGIECNQKGQHIGYSDPFVNLLTQHAVDFSSNHFIDGGKPVMKSKGKSSLKKWECGCMSVRVGKKDFAARCLKCGMLFKLSG
jgi:hypothetical protein